MKENIDELKKDNKNLNDKLLESFKEKSKRNNNEEKTIEQLTIDKKSL